MAQVELLASDLHLMDKPSEEYRFGIFEQLQELAIEHKVKRICLLGDLFDQKDRHPGVLVNRVVNGLVSWTQYVDEVLILYGNHDSISSETPFLKFIEHIPKIRYINQPTVEQNRVYLPHSRQPLEDWKDIDMTGKLVFAHVTVSGSKAENGFDLESSVQPDYFKNSLATFSGDVHVAQTIGPVNYIGSPYDTRFNSQSHGGSCLILHFGDDFDGGFGVLDTETLEFTRHPLWFPKKLMLDVTGPRDLELKLGKWYPPSGPPSQVKIRFHVDREHVGGWSEARTEMIKWVEACGHVL